MSSFSSTSPIIKAWDIFKKDWQKVYTVAGAMFIIMVLLQVLEHAVKHQPLLVLMVTLISIVVGVMVEMAGIYFVLKIVRSQAFKLEEAPKAFQPSERMLTYFWGKFLVGILVMVGLILLVVPGVIWMLKYLLTPFVIVDQKISVSEAMKKSNHMTDGHKWDLLVLMLIIIGLNILGAIPFGLGLLVTIPVTYLVMAVTYEQLK